MYQKLFAVAILATGIHSYAFAQHGCPLDHFAIGQDGGSGSPTGKLIVDVSTLYETNVSKPYASHYPLNYSASKQAYINGEPGAEQTTNPEQQFAGTRMTDYDIWLEIVEVSDNLWIGAGSNWYTTGGRIRLSSYADHHLHMNYWVWASVYDPQKQYYAVFRLVDDLDDGQRYEISEEFWVVLNRPVPGDFNADGHIDSDDLDVFKACKTGPAIPYDPTNLPPGCTLTPDNEGIIPADLDRDGDVDQDDFAMFQRCYSGPQANPDPRCAR
ncbi:MAG: hypothetical protein GXY44_10525 [Phycisphaerales bacterium]|nr:hypothetical protein [Phycisphaerales bacterium]